MPTSGITTVYHFCSSIPSELTNIIQLHQTALGFAVLKKISPSLAIEDGYWAVSLLDKSLSE